MILITIRNSNNIKTHHFNAAFILAGRNNNNNNNNNSTIYLIENTYT